MEFKRYNYENLTLEECVCVCVPKAVFFVVAEIKLNMVIHSKEAPSCSVVTHVRTKRTEPKKYAIHVICSLPDRFWRWDICSTFCLGLYYFQKNTKKHAPAGDQMTFLVTK